MCKDSVIQKKNQHCKIQIQPFLKVKNCKTFNPFYPLTEVKDKIVKTQKQKKINKITQP